MIRQCCVVLMLAGLTACGGQHRGTQTSVNASAAPLGAAVAHSPPASAKDLPLYPNAVVDTSEGDNGRLDQPTLRMASRYYKTTDSYNAVSRWYVAHANGWGIVQKPGGGSMIVTHKANPAENIMIDGGNGGTTIVIQRFQVNQ